MRSPLFVGSVLVLVAWADGFGCSSTPGSAGGSSGHAGTGAGGTAGGTAGVGGPGGASAGAAGGHGGGGAAGGGAGGSRDGGATDARSVHDGAGTNNGPCWAASDCPPGATCIPPGQQTCGGACIAAFHPCAADIDCASGDASTGAPSICDPVVCSCPAGKGCQPGCRGDADCAPAMSCGGDHRCAARACTSASGSCPADFTCGSTGTCARKGCTFDTGCSKACVEGACYGTPGICVLPAP